MSKVLRITSEILFWCLAVIVIMSFLPIFLIAAFFGAFLGGLFEG
jgi:hypothetical protein